MILSNEYIRHLTESGSWQFSNVKSVGELGKLTTKSKVDVVSAINELNNIFLVNEDVIGNVIENIADINDMISSLDGALEEEKQRLIDLTVIVSEDAEKATNYANAIKKELEGKLIDSNGKISSLLDKANMLEQKVNENATRVDGQLVAISQELVNTNAELSNKLSRIEFDESVGVNKWISTFYDISPSPYKTIYPKIEDMATLKASSVDEINDSVKLYPFQAKKTGLLHLFTNVRLSSAKTIEVNIQHSYGMSVLMNGGYVYYKAGEGSSNISLSLRGGWNTVEILLGVDNSVGSINLNAKLSELVDKMTTTIGVGGKDETRLTHNETLIKQTNEQISLKADNTVVEQLGNKVETNTADILINAKEISSRVSNEEFNKYTGRLEDAETSITQTSEKIEQLATKETVDTLNGIVKEHTTNLTQLNDSISLSATKGELNEVEGRVSTAQGAIDVLAGEVNLRASKNELDKLTEKVTSQDASIKANAGEIALKASKIEVQGQVENAIGKIQVGGRNIIPNTIDSLFTRDNHVGWGTNLRFPEQKTGELRFRISATNSIGGVYMKDRALEPMVAGEDYVLSFFAYIDTTENISQQLNYTYIMSGDTGVSNSAISEASKMLVTNVKKRIVIPFKAQRNYNLYSVMIGVINLPENIVGKDFVISKLKLERGNKATDWTPAPEDSKKELDATVKKLETSITANSEEIKLKASQSILDKATGKIDSLEASLNVAKDEIATKVSSVDYESGMSDVNERIAYNETAINQTKDEIALKASSSDVELLTGKLESAESKLNVQSEMIETKVSRIISTTDFSKIFVSPLSLESRENGWVGYAVIKTNIKPTATMYDMSFSGYNHSNLNNDINFRVGFHAYTSETPVKSYGFTNKGNFDIGEFRIGITSRNTIDIIVGTRSTEWVYPSFNVERINASYTKPSDDIIKGWELLMVNDYRNGDRQAYSKIFDVPVHSFADKDYVTNLTNTAMKQTDEKISLMATKLEVGDVVKRISTAEQKITPNAIVSTVTGSEGFATAVTQKIDSWGVAVKDRLGKVELAVKPDSIVSTVTGSEGFSTAVTQKMNSWGVDVVRSDEVLSTINASTEGVKIKGDLVDITGKVTFTSLDPSTQELIIDAESLANDAYNTANDASSLASSASSKATNASNLASSASSLASSTNNALWEWKHPSDTTTINGGKIYTGSISAYQLSATAIDGKTITGSTIRTSTTATTNGVIMNNTGIYGYGGGVNKFSLSNTGKLTATDAVINGKITASEDSVFSGSISTGRDLTVGNNIYMTYNYSDRFKSKGIIFSNTTSDTYETSITGTYLKLDLVGNSVNVFPASDGAFIVHGSARTSGRVWANGGLSVSGTADFSNATVTGITATFS